MRKKLLTVLIVGFLLAGISARADDGVGNPAPPLVIKQLDGKVFDLSRQTGQIVILHFWATWCPSCKQEMPVLDAFYRGNKGKGVKVLAVSVDKASHRDEVADAMKPFDFPGALISDASANGFGAQSAIPATYVIDPAGIVRAILTPDQTELTAASLSAAVQPLRLP